MPGLIQPLSAALDGYLLDLTTGNRIYSTKALKAVILQDRSATIIYNTTANIQEVKTTSSFGELTASINNQTLEATICQ